MLVHFDDYDPKSRDQVVEADKADWDKLVANCTKPQVIHDHNGNQVGLVVDCDDNLDEDMYEKITSLPDLAGDMTLNQIDKILYCIKMF